MAYFGKTFNFVGEENFASFVDAAKKIPDAFKEKMKGTRPAYTLIKNPDGSYTLTNSGTGYTHSNVMTFTPGVEFDEKINEDVTAKTTVTVNGDTFTQVQKFDDGLTITIKREYSGNDLKVTITGSFFDGFAVRLYKA